MNIFTWIFLLFSFTNSFSAERIKLQAKKLIEGKVIAHGQSFVAKSLPQCIDYCSKRLDTCDGFVFHEIIGKCRLISKCAPAFQIDNSTNVVYYSRRPQIKFHGFIHDPKTDSCLGLIVAEMDYPSAEALCIKQNANVAVLNKKYLNDMAKDLLSNSTSEWAWIKDDNIANREGSKSHGISGNDVLSEVFSPEVLHWRNDSRSCWGVNKLGQWGQFSCKNSTMFVLCQVSLFDN